ncbi:MAG: hydrogenase maturation protease [Candidatus Geothermincolales bacterium]
MSVQDLSRYVIIGIGNPLCRDDGFGVHALRYLRGRVPEEVELVEGSIYGPDLLPFLEGKAKAIFIDALDAGEEPGALFRFSPEQVSLELPSIPVSLHDFGVYDLLRAAELLGQRPEEVVIIAAQVKDLGVGMELSPELEALLPRVCELVLEEIGDACREKGDC